MHAHNFYSSRPCLWAPLHIKRSPFLFPFPFAVTGSASLIADAGHSLSDLISDGLALAATAPRLETVCTQGIAVLLCLAGCSMIAQGWGAFVAMRGTIAAGVASASPVLDAVALSVALVSIGAKEALYRVTHAVGLRCGSSTLVANAHHHRSDAMSSVAAAVGLGASIAGLRVWTRSPRWSSAAWCWSSASRRPSASMTTDLHVGAFVHRSLLHLLPGMCAAVASQHHFFLCR